MISRELIAASTEPLILSILQQGENYGYAISEKVQAFSKGKIEWTEGMLYPVLHRLERRGLLRSRWEAQENGRKRRYYAITTSGKKFLAERRKEWETVHATLNEAWAPDMFDLEEHLRQWRAETEATLAFEPEELDELEDHLRFAYESALKEKLVPEAAWQHGLSQLGPASALALEFTKSKLLPALVNLLRTWWKPGLLLAFYFATILMLYSYDSYLVDWTMAWVCIVATFLLLPAKSYKTALLLGAGNSFCFIPLLYLLIYQGPIHHFLGADWSHQGASFGWAPILLAISGLFILNAWGWKHLRQARHDLPGVLAVIGLIVILFALAPVMGEALGTLSTWQIHRLPDAAHVPYTGDVRSSFLQWKFVEVLLSCVATLNLWIALLSMILLASGILIHQSLVRGWNISPPSAAKVFPSEYDLPRLLMMVASGVFYVMTTWVEPPFTENMRVTAARVGYQPTHEVGAEIWIGAEIWVLYTAALFLVSIYELTKRWTRATQLRLFYVCTVIVIELILVTIVPLFTRLVQQTPFNPGPVAHSAIPAWLSSLLIVAALVMIGRQIQLTWKKTREKRTQISLCKLSGADLVQAGLLFGLFLAGAGEVFMLIAIALAYQSTMLIGCLIAWGSSVKDPIAHPFHPEIYGLHEHLSFITYSGLIYVWFCVIGGLLMVIVLSGLEFIRFNGFRLYKVRKIRQATVARIPVLNE